MAKEKPLLTCATDGCKNKAYIEGGKCVKHGGWSVRICSAEGCNNKVKREGVCIKHGAEEKRRTCTHEGCNNKVQTGGVCFRHGAKKLICKVEGCNSQVQKKGVCTRHGGGTKGYVRKPCSHQGCTNKSMRKGMCDRHAGRKLCSYEGCTKNSRRGGVCMKHGLKCNKEGCTNAIVDGPGYTIYCERHTICRFPGCEAMKVKGYHYGCDLSEHRFSSYCEIVDAPAPAFCQVIEEDSADV